MYSNFWNSLLRVDHQVNPQNTFGFRWLRDYQPIVNRSGSGTAGLDDERQTLQALHDERDYDNTAMVTYNMVLGGTRLNTIRAAMTKEDVDRGSTAYHEAGGDMLVQPPTLRHVSFDAQSTDFALLRVQTSYQLDESFSWFMPGRRGDHDLKFGLQYVWADHRQNVQHLLNGVFTFPSDRAFNAAAPSTYPERLSVRVPSPELPYVFTHSIGLFAQDKWRFTNNLTLNLGIRYDVEIAPIEERFNPLFSDPNDYPVDWNNIQPRVGLAYSITRDSVVRAGYGMFYEKLWTNRSSPSSGRACSPARSSRSSPSPSPIRDRPGAVPADPMLQNGPVVNRERLAQLFPPERLRGPTARCSSTRQTVRFPTRTRYRRGTNGNLAGSCRSRRTTCTAGAATWFLRTISTRRYGLIRAGRGRSHASTSWASPASSGSHRSETRCGLERTSASPHRTTSAFSSRNASASCGARAHPTRSAMHAVIVTQSRLH